MVSKIFIIGVGPGNPEYLTKRAIDAISESDIVFGAGKVLQNIRETFSDKKFVNEYRAEKIYEILNSATSTDKSLTLPADTQTVSICFSGSINLYSGAPSAIRFFAEKGIDVEEIDGLSSVSYFLSKLHISENEVKIISIHGRDFDVLSQVRTHKYTAVLLSNTAQLIELAKKINPDGELNKTKIYLGENLSLPDERITIGNPRNFILFKPIDRALSIVIFQNDNFDKSEGFFIPDKNYIREFGDSHSKKSIPMTKENIRTIALEKLSLKRDSVLWDIGAGTGSVSIAAALRIPEGRVYSFEKNSEAVKLCKKNIQKFEISNIEVIEGMAPESFSVIMDTPTHAFIGGAGRNLSSIVERLLSINPDIKILISAVTLETISECEKMSERFTEYEFSFSEIAVTEYENLGHYHLRKALNPVMLISIR